jgi:multiple sugar transport system permease protein
MMPSVGAPPVRTRRHGRTLRQREAIEGFAFVSLWVIGFVIFTAGPIVGSLFLSFTRYDMMKPPTFVGLDNYVTLIAHDPIAVHSTIVTLIYAAVAVPFQLLVALVMAVLLNQRLVGMRAFRTAFYLPSMASGVAVAILWLWIFNPVGGPINGFLSLVGVQHPPQWFFSTQWALPALIIMSLWTVGPTMVIFLAGLQGIPPEVQEAAQIDGAGLLARFLGVTLPLLSPVLFFNLVLGLIGALQTFTNAFVITNGGPEQATYFYILFLYNNAWVYNKMGYASAMAWLLAIAIMLVTLVVFRSGRWWVYYEHE